MSNESSKLPNANAVKELRDLYNKRKEERFKKHKDFVEILKKETPNKKVARTTEHPEIEE